MNPTWLTDLGRALAAPRCAPFAAPAEIEPHALLVGISPEVWFAGWRGPYPSVTLDPDLARKLTDAHELRDTETRLTAWGLRVVALPCVDGCEPEEDGAE